MAATRSTEFPTDQCFSTPLPQPSTPLQVSGFLSGKTIQVHGDTEDLQFSVQFNIHHKHHSPTHLHFSDVCTSETRTPQSPFSSSYMTPITMSEDDDQNARTEKNQLEDEPNWSSTGGGCSRTGSIVTRLRSGVLTPVSYDNRAQCMRRMASDDSSLWRKQMTRIRRKGRGKRDLLKRVLKRHSSPIRPYSSYTFFVMATWGVVKSSLFSETSKMLGEMWCRLPHNEKKVFKNMAMKDNARYKRQCRLLRSN